MISLIEFEPGMRVVYVPANAHGDKHHPSCERGIVSSIGDQFVFVKFYGKHSAEACDIEDLQKA